MTTKRTNDLIKESSAYLLQHAHNPVNWLPWGEAAFKLSKEHHKPILISIGYSACHWCHVMERESFENEEVAAFMNEHFICIKVDREERPDLDHYYMEALQLLRQSGGWPLNMFLTPEGLPFYGGTYFPPEPIYNRPSWKDVLYYIKDVWENKYDEVIKQSQQLNSGIASLTDGWLTERNADEQTFETVAYGMRNKLMQSADKRNGGWGSAPKFPQFNLIRYLMYYGYYQKDKECIDQALLTLKKMIRGGIYDQLKGGICRYSTDEQWLVPHFEKMLYDNAQLIFILAEAFQLTKDEEYRFALLQTIQFCEEELLLQNGCYASSLDADTEGEEGKYYLWDHQEIEHILSVDATAFCNYYSITNDGNWDGKNILQRSETIHDDKFIQSCHDKLIVFRNKRKRPQRDDKIILGWNAAMILGLSKAAAALNNTVVKQKAINGWNNLMRVMTLEGNHLAHSSTYIQQPLTACLDDYAMTIAASLSLQEITGEVEFLEKAYGLTEYVQKHFNKSVNGLFDYTHSLQTDIIKHQQDLFDTSLPSGNSLMAYNLFHIGRIYEKLDWIKDSKDLSNKVATLMKRYPESMGQWAILFLFHNQEPEDWILTGSGCEKLLSAALELFRPLKLVQASVVEKNYPLLKNKKFDEGPLLYVCENFTCKTPISSIDGMSNEVLTSYF